MEKISKNILDIEKALSEMKNEITNIKSSTYNTNSTNSLNISNNIHNKNNERNKGKFQNYKNNLKLSKNYFQLAEKEKYFPHQKNLLKNTQSFSLNKKGFNIYNNIFLNSNRNKNIKNDDYKAPEKQEELSEINFGTISKNLKSNLISKENKKINNHKLFKRYFTSKHININNNKAKKEARNIKSFNTITSKKLNKYNKSLKSSLFSYMDIKEKKNKKKYNFKLLINYNLPQEELELNYLNQNNFINSHQSTNDENIDCSNYLTHNKNHINENEELANKKNKIYSQILNILEGESINNLITKSNLFDKYGTKGFENFINNNNEISLSKNNLDNICKYLKEYKNFICNKLIND